MAKLEKTSSRTFFATDVDRGESLTLRFEAVKHPRVRSFLVVTVDGLHGRHRTFTIPVASAVRDMKKSDKFLLRQRGKDVALLRFDAGQHEKFRDWLDSVLDRGFSEHVLTADEFVFKKGTFTSRVTKDLTDPGDFEPNEFLPLSDVRLLAGTGEAMLSASWSSFADTSTYSQVDTDVLRESLLYDRANLGIIELSLQSEDAQALGVWLDALEWEGRDGRSRVPWPPPRPRVSLRRTTDVFQLAEPSFTATHSKGPAYLPNGPILFALEEDKDGPTGVIEVLWSSADEPYERFEVSQAALRHSLSANKVLLGPLKLSLWHQDTLALRAWLDALESNGYRLK